MNSFEEFIREVTEERYREYKKTRDRLNAQTDYEGKCFEFYQDFKEHHPEIIAIYNGDHILLRGLHSIVLDYKSIWIPFELMDELNYEEAKNWNK